MNRKKMELLTVLSAILFTLTLINVQSAQSIAPTTKVSLTPAILYGEPGDFVKVNVTVYRVEYLYAWQVNVTFNPEVLGFVDVTEGDFLARQPNGTLGGRRIGDGYAFFGWSTRGVYVGESGTGTLATLEFEVLARGASPIKFKTNPRGEVYPTEIKAQLAPNPPPNWKVLRPPADFTVENSLFVNTIIAPTARFAYSPKPPGIDTPITFDASESNAAAPLEITKYVWDFGDGDNATVTTPTIEHTYTEGGTYTVSLTVIDNATAPEEVKSHFNLTDDEMPLVWYELFSTKEETIGIAFQRDVAVIYVAVLKPEATIGETASINVTVRNEGTVSEDFDVTVFYGTKEGDTKLVSDLNAGDEETLIFYWDTTGEAKGSYQIKAVASEVEGEGNVQNNEFIDGTITLVEASESFPIILVVGGALGAVVILAAILLILRRRKSSST